MRGVSSVVLGAALRESEVPLTFTVIPREAVLDLAVHQHGICIIHSLSRSLGALSK